MSISSVDWRRDFTFRGSGAGKSVCLRPVLTAPPGMLRSGAGEHFFPIIGKGIAELDAKGKLSRISIKYFGKDITRPTAE